MSSPSARITYLRSLPSIRTECAKVFALAESNQLEYWDVDLTQEPKIVDFVCSLIERDYGTNYASIPPHGRWRHFVGGRVDPLLARWGSDNVEAIEVARRMVDLMVASVLMDAGAGNVWKYVPKEGGEGIGRSEGLAVGSLEMFEKGMFSGVEGQPFRVDSVGLSQISTAQISDAMQVTSQNPMDGIEGRANLLVRLGSVLTDPANAAYFTKDGASRPGHLIDYLIAHPTSIQIPSPNSYKIAVDINTLWEIVVGGLSGVWPAARTKIDGVSLGDVWPVQSLGGELVPFHKLSQWLSYSLIEVMEVCLGWKFIGKETMTGLPEYRNGEPTCSLEEKATNQTTTGGLLVDFGLLTPRIPALLKSFDLPVPTPLPELLSIPPIHASHSAIVEFRAVTVIMLDRLADGIRKKTGDANYPNDGSVLTTVWDNSGHVDVSYTPVNQAVGSGHVHTTSVIFTLRQYFYGAHQFDDKIIVVGTITPPGDFSTINTRLALPSRFYDGDNSDQDDRTLSTTGGDGSVGEWAFQVIEQQSYTSDGTVAKAQLIEFLSAAPLINITYIAHP
ncbi:hypothetical protein P7C70_g7288, partial [Phenoliferia sp. Uapishka_3]